MCLFYLKYFVALNNQNMLSGTCSLLRTTGTYSPEHVPEGEPLQRRALGEMLVPGFCFLGS